MDSAQVSLLVLGLILIVGVQTGSGIRCYVCNSHYASEQKGDDCMAPKTELFVKDCNTMHPERGLNYTYCRKTVQTVDDDYRVIRSCASKARLDRGCIERTGTKAIKLRYCECAGDLCNAAPKTFTINVFLMTLVSGVLAFIYHS